jgi:sugar lactone lactonase YvrE
MPPIAPRPLPLLALAILLCGACTRPNPAYGRRVARDGAPIADAPPGGPDPDAAPPTDGGRNDASDGPPGAPDGGISCGSARPDLSAVVGTDGLAIASDGTIYFTSDDGTHGWVGRMPPGQPAELDWLRIDWAPTLRGLALDEARDRLYVASVSGRAIIVFDNLSGSASGTVLIERIDEVNDLAVDAAGNVYYGLQRDRHIYRIGPQGGAAERVTLQEVGDPAAGQAPAALAFAPDGALLVGMKNGGPIHRLVLAGGVEQSRSAFGTFDGWANGMAFDSAGRLYVGLYHDSNEARLVRLDADGFNLSDQLSGGRYGSLAFGRGPLDCRDLYAAQPHAAMQRLPTDTPGRPPPP